MALLARLHRDGGLTVRTVDAQDRPIARSVLYPDGDLTTTVRADIDIDQVDAHVQAVQAQADALRQARKHFFAWLAAAGGGVTLVVTGLTTDSSWVQWVGAAELIAQGGAALRFGWRLRQTDSASTTA
jgi:hypothetical protein